MRKTPVFIVALIVAAGVFFVTMLTNPPKTVAAQPLSSINIHDLFIAKDVPLAKFADAF